MSLNDPESRPAKYVEVRRPRYPADKGFGFIKTGSNKDIFFHSSSLQGVTFDDLRKGQKVTFLEGRGPKGPCAKNVKPA